MRSFGQTSLLVYWVHVELVYGLCFKRPHEPPVDGQATVGLRADDGGDAGRSPCCALKLLARGLERPRCSGWWRRLPSYS